MKCCIVKDLLSNYIDGQNCEKTNEEIRKHLEICPDCCSDYEKMTASISLERLPEAKSIDFYIKLKRTILKRNLLLVLFISVVFISLFLFARNYDITLPFDPEHMSVEVFRAAIVTNEDGNIAWKALDDLDFEETQSFVLGELKEIHLAEIAYQGISNIAETDHNGRTICQNGESIRIVYYCYRKPLWDCLFSIDGLKKYKESGAVYGSFLYGEKYECADYQPQKIEIYYLQRENLEELDELSDEEFSDLRKQAIEVWDGVIF